MEIVPYAVYNYFPRHGTMNFRSELQSQRKHGKIERATPVNGNLVNCVISLYLLQKEFLVRIL